MRCRLTSLSLFAAGFDLAYSITFPFDIHSVRMRKECESAGKQTPSKFKMFGWDKCFQAMISRHNRWAKAEREWPREVHRKYLENPAGIPVNPEVLDSYGTSLVSPVAHVCEPPVVANFPDTHVFLLKEVLRGYNHLFFANLANEPYASLPERVIEA